MHLDVLKPSCVEAKPTVSRAFEELAVARKTACPSHQDLMSAQVFFSAPRSAEAAAFCAAAAAGSRG